MEAKIICAGFGGQGVLSLGQLIAYSALAEGKEVTWFPAYGPEMRGGTANCSVIVSQKPIGSPVVLTPNVACVFNKPSYDKFYPTVEKGGILFINSSLIEDKCPRTDITVKYIDTLKIANALGEVRIANMVMLGAYVEISKIVRPETVLKVIDEKFAHKPKVIPLNKQAFEQGAQLVR